jgi:ABC-type phosphate transport system substrate-binding protein
MIKKSKALMTTSTLQTIYTVPNGKTAEWKMLWISNHGSNNGHFDVMYYNKESDTTFTFFEDHQLSSKGFFDVGGEYYEFVVMHEGDYIQVSADTGMTAVVSVVEHNDIIKGG